MFIDRIVAPRVGEPNAFVNIIAEAARHQEDQREKLRWIDGLLGDGARELWPEELVYLAIYLVFIAGTDFSSPCYSGLHGTSPRPTGANRTPQPFSERAFITRKIYPCLASCTSPIAGAESGKQIKDDAPDENKCRELKRQIRIAIQNMVYRSANRGSLAISATPVGRIDVSDLGCPGWFVEEIEDVFISESVEGQLEAITQKKAAELVDLSREAAGTKAQTPPQTLEQLMTTLKFLTSFRGRALDKLNAAKGPIKQELQMVDIALQDFFQSVLAHIMMRFEASEGGIRWSSALDCLTLGFGNLRLGDFEAAECEAIEFLGIRTRSKIFYPLQQRDRPRIKRVSSPFFC